MDKFWLQSYPPTIAAEIDVTQYRSLVHMMEESFRKFAARKAFVCMGKTLTYAELDVLSRQLGAWLQNKGIQKGARVAIMMPNVLQYPIAILGILRAGYTVVNINPLYTPRELEHQLNDSGAEVIIVLENFAHTLEPVISRTPLKHVVVARMGDLLGGVKGAMVNFVVRNVKKMVPDFSLPASVPFKQMLREASGLTLQPCELNHDDIAFLQYTGGTTGVSKGAVLLHRNLIANVLQCDAWLQPGYIKAPHVEQLIFVSVLPLYHVYALTVCCLLGMRAGALNLLIPNPRDIPGLVKTLSQYKFNVLPAINTLFNGLMSNPEFAKLDFSLLKVTAGGGMAVQKTVAEKWFKITGCPIAEGYGLSETSPLISCNLTDIAEFNDTIGLPFPSTEVLMLNDAGDPVPTGQPGEIAVRGPQVMAGYWNHPDETRKVMTPDGFFKTGDIGIMDAQGYIKIVDRKKDMILVSGFNVYPNEIEEVIAAHPGVMECACIGVPDDKTGEAVKVFVVRKNRELTAEQLADYCKEQLTGYKRPKHIEFRDQLPKSPIGKILRKDLRTRPA